MYMSQLAVLPIQSAGTRQKGQQGAIPVISCYCMPSLTRHLWMESLSKPAMLVASPFLFSGPMFISPLSRSALPGLPLFPHPLPSLVLCASPSILSGFSDPQPSPLCSPKEEGRHCAAAEDGEAVTVADISGAENCIYCSLHSPGKAWLE